MTQVAFKFQNRQILMTVCAMLAIVAAVEGQTERVHDTDTPSAVVAVAHKSCTTDNLSSDDLRKMLLGDIRTWPDASRIILIEQPDDSSVQQRILRMLLRTDPAGYKRQLLAAQFQGKELPIIKTLSTDDNAIKFVWNLPGAIALVNAAAAGVNSSRVKVLRIDGKFPGEPGYTLQ